MIRNAGNFVEAYYYYENNLSTYSNSTLDSDDQYERKRMNSSPTLAGISKQYSNNYSQFADYYAKQPSYNNINNNNNTNTLSTNPSSFSNQTTNNNHINITPLTQDLKNTLQLSNKLEDIQEDSSSPDSGSNGKKQTDTTKYKTELCNTFSLTGFCDYGPKCRFAHGKDELQRKAPTQNNILFKTKLCKAFHEKTYCPYGQRCHFLHEIRTVCQIQSKRVYQKKLNLDSTFLKANPNTSSNSKQVSRLPIFNYICSSNNIFQNANKQNC